MSEKIEIVPENLAKKKGKTARIEKKLKKAKELYSGKGPPKKPNCSHKKSCYYKCHTLNSNDIFFFHKEFYKTSSKIDQDNMIIKFTEKTTVKRHRPRNKASTRTRTASNKYYILKRQTGTRVSVCLTAFCSALQIKPGRIKGVTNRSGISGQCAKENRGGNRKKLLFSSKREAIQKFIMKFKPLESHYCRGKIKKRVYLDPSLSINKMFRMYEDEAQPGYSVSKSLFRKVFNTSFNIGFGSPRQDVCSDCLQFTESLKFAKTEMEKQTIRTHARIHKLRYKCFFKALQEQKPGLLTISFDCQKNLPLPRVPDQSVYYSRQLYLYNFTVVVGDSHSNLTPENVFAYIWTEDVSSKGSNEICSALYDCLNKLDLQDVSVLRLVADGCGGQNKNTIVLGMVAKWLHDQEKVEKVEIIYPVTGHSFIPPDRVFAYAEKKIKKTECIIQPKEYMEIIAEHATIRRLGTEIPICDWKSCAKDLIKSTQSLHFQISKIKRILIHKDGMKVMVRGEISYRNDINSAAPIIKRGKRYFNYHPHPLPNTGVTVKPEKLNDVSKLLLKHFGATWNEIPELTYYKTILERNPVDFQELNENDEEIHDDEEVLDFV